jgi:tripartite-type tricarboxylate transporter receptor subunit TctC
MASLGLSLVAASANAQSVEDFYSGKRIRLIVGSNPGGAYDAFARVMVPYLSKYIPGHPTFFVENRRGGGGLYASNHLYNIVPRDGSVIGLVERGAVMDPVFNANGNALYDSRKFNWIGSPSQEIGLGLVRQPSPITTMADFRKHGLIVSSSTRSSLSSIYPRLFNGMFGTKFKVVEGYKSATEALIALDRGEVEGHIAPASSGVLRAQISPWIESRRVKVVMQIGFKKDSAYPDAEMITDLAETAEDKALFRLMFAQLAMAYPLVAPPEVPNDRVEALRKAFDRVVTDPDFLAAASKWKLQVNPVSGIQIHELLDRVYETPPDVLDRYRQLTAESAK